MFLFNFVASQIAFCQLHDLSDERRQKITVRDNFNCGAWASGQALISNTLRLMYLHYQQKTNKSIPSLGQRASVNFKYPAFNVLALSAKNKQINPKLFLRAYIVNVRPYTTAFIRHTHSAMICNNTSRCLLHPGL